MPLYFFNISDGVSAPDTDGSYLSNLAEAKAAAVQLAGAVLKESGTSFWNGDGWSLDVVNEAGRILFTLSFTAEVATGEVVEFRVRQG